MAPPAERASLTSAAYAMAARLVEVEDWRSVEAKQKPVQRGLLNPNRIGLLMRLGGGFKAVEAALEEAQQASVPIAEDEQ